MLSPGRALALNAEAGKPLPKVPGLRDLYAAGTTPRHGEVVMIAGRSGHQKSGLALWYVAQMNLPTLYFSADMSAFTASSRLASMVADQTTEEVEEGMRRGFGPDYQDMLADLRITFSFGSPITWRQVDEELQAYVELWDEWPQVIVIDNLMDVADAESDYTVQMAAMSTVTEIARETGATVIVLHHASDKTPNALTNPYDPPARSEIKNGLAEKPELCLTVALDPHTHNYRIATVKQRMGPNDPSGRRFVVLRAEPSKTRFHATATPSIYV